MPRSVNVDASPKSLAHALPDPRLRAMMSMRSDFLGGLQNDEPLFNVHRQINVPPLREAELRNVVSRPAELLSARFETAGLVDIITRRTAEDSVKDVGALPLLSYTLDDMWTQMAKRGDGVLRLPAAILRTRRRAGRPRQHVSGDASGRRGCAPAGADAEARDCARGRRADAAARPAFRVLGRGVAARLRACRSPQSSSRHGHSRERRDLCRGGARGDLSALGQAARMDRRGAGVFGLAQRSRSRAPRLAGNVRMLRRTMRC